MKNTSSVLVRILVTALLAGGVMVGIRRCGARDTAAPDQPTTLASSLASLSPEELRSLGVEGDTPADTLHTLIGALNTVRAQQKQLSQENAALRQQNIQWRRRGQDITGEVRDAVSRLQTQYDERARRLQAEQLALRNQLQSMADRRADTADAAARRPDNAGDIPLGLGLDGLGGQPQTQAVTGPDGLRWVAPDDRPPSLPGPAAGKLGQGFPVSFLSGDPLAAGTAVSGRKRQDAGVDNLPRGMRAEQPVFTLPVNATLVGSRAMTALLGRVPVNGTVIDPYPFKILIGRDNLTANGIDLPDVEGAVAAGYASGDWTLSCVRGQVNSLTFVFADGTVRTLPALTGAGSGTGNAGGEGKTSPGTTGGIGWISDDNGIPCISGTRKSNAATWLPTLFALSAAGAAGDALSQGQQTTQTNGYGGVTSTLTGDAGRAALGKAMAGGMREAGEWVKQRYGQMFDAIYVPPGAHLAVHITRSLNIDYENRGRRVRHAFTLPADSGAEGGLD